MQFQLTDQETAIYLKYAKLNIPRHTSYPAAPYWQDAYPFEGVHEALTKIAEQKHPLSLYLHIPFCRQLCFYCACTKEIYPEERQKKKDPRESLVEGFVREMQIYARYVQDNTVEQIHFGGGTPTFLKPEQLQRLMQAIRSHFKIAEHAEIAIEVDPRVTSFEHLQTLRTNGFNRISLGVQDFSETVQKAVNRIQSYECVDKIVREARSLHFDSINFDLIYGLPFQTLESMQKTLEQTLKLSPDRIAFYRLAMIPEIFKWQKSFGREHLPPEADNIKMFLTALNTFTENGFEFIGLDHFAKKEEMLSEAIEDKTLRRNFQGMTTGKNLAILGMGPSAVSQIPGAYFWQNKKTSEEWLESLSSQSLKFCKGMKLSEDDRIRQELIQELYCYGVLNWNELSERLNVDTKRYFDTEIRNLNDLVEEKILNVSEEGFALSSVLGRLLVRLVASRFDHHLQEELSRTQSTRFSQLG